MTFRLVQERAAGGVLVAVACRVLRVSTSGYYEWRGRAPSPRAVADAALTAQIREIHASSRGTYGVPRVHAELRLCAAVLDVSSRRIMGWSIAAHLRGELVVDALEMARWRRRPVCGETVLHSDRGAQYTSWAFGHRLRAAGLLRSVGRVGSAPHNHMM